MLRRVTARAWTLVDPQWRRELAGERTLFRYLERRGELERFRGKRILEVGPKHGEDSRLLAGLQPSRLVLVDLAGHSVSEWLPSVPAAEYVEANVLYLSDDERLELGQFDLIFCLGVLYHNVEQVRLLRRLFELASEGAMVVVETATTRNRFLAHLNVVQVHWPHFYEGLETITHLPSRRAVVSWMQMVGFTDVRLIQVYSRPIRWQRAVVTGRRAADARPYLNYGEYAAGTAS